VPKRILTYLGFIPRSSRKSIVIQGRLNIKVLAVLGSRNQQGKTAALIQTLLDGIKEKGADIVIFSIAVYYRDMTESMRTFTDRLRRCSAPISSRTNNNKNFKPVIGICHAGGGGGGAETCIVSLNKFLSQCGFEVIDMILVRRQDLPIKLKNLRNTGKWLFDHVETGEWEKVIPRPKTVR
jgi:hypothetical protein